MGGNEEETAGIHCRWQKLNLNKKWMKYWICLPIRVANSEDNVGEVVVGEWQKVKMELGNCGVELTVVVVDNDGNWQPMKSLAEWRMNITVKMGMNEFAIGSNCAVGDEWGGGAVWEWCDGEFGMEMLAKTFVVPSSSNCFIFFE
jgi:hypothetical protein